MNIISIILVAISLSFDTFAVSVSTGFAMKKIRFLQILKIALILTLFQSAMPLIGWCLGSRVEKIINNYDHWVAFVLLIILGTKMIIESFKIKNNINNTNLLKTRVIIGIAIATSIDALVIGVSFAFIEMNILLAVIIIGLITYIASLLGIVLGKNFGHHFGNKMEIVGGIILISIGFRVLINHMLF